MKTPKKATRAALVATLREHTIYRTESGGRLVGRFCSLCETRWRGFAERHQPFCILAGETARG
jgi:hypothetical protein